MAGRLPHFFALDTAEERIRMGHPPLERMLLISIWVREQRISTLLFNIFYISSHRTA